jgi:hypothetical protein
MTSAIPVFGGGIVAIGRDSSPKVPSCVESREGQDQPMGSDGDSCLKKKDARPKAERPISESHAKATTLSGGLKRAPRPSGRTEGRMFILKKTTKRFTVRISTRDFLALIAAVGYLASYLHR